ncbi:hypothetical protein MRB53_025833 [Persea americana]|uniref:Uncharacterized protein n=1 Tax=Persea americana TaxID=3435 RepID=A0ACC2LGJ3_PERAE|nr:hypothetical protein MRB53_025833 [Persea americana]
MDGAIVCNDDKEADEGRAIHFVLEANWAMHCVGFAKTTSMILFSPQKIPEKSEVRLKLVSVWLPVLIVCREKNVSPIPSGQKQLYQELEETFLRIISSLPMSAAESLLHHCLSFATRNVEDCPHLVISLRYMVPAGKDKNAS